MSSHSQVNSNSVPNPVFDGFRKRSGWVVAFQPAKIAGAIQAAVEAVARKTNTQVNKALAPRVSEAVVRSLCDPGSEYYVHADSSGKRIPNIEDVQDLVEILLAEEGETLVVAAYKRYR